MHRHFFLLAFIFFQYTIYAQSEAVPERVYSVTKVYKSLDYYETQANLWEKETRKNSKNAGAWFNFFTAARMANIFTPAGEGHPYDMTEIAENIIANIPNTFEYYYLLFWQNNPSEEAYEHLQKAYEMAPERYETYHDFITKAEFERDTASIRKFSEKWYNHELYSPGITNWNYNVFQSVEPNAILMTHGDNDTYPLWLLQYLKNVRRDVCVLNASLLLHDNYRKTIFKEAGIPAFEKTINDFPSRTAFFNALAEHVVKNAPRPVYLGLSLPQDLRELWDEQLYLTGLTFKYSEKEFDNKAVIRNNFENKFLTDYLKFSFQDDFSESVVRFMNQQYIPCLTVLYEHYRLSGEIGKSDDVQKILFKIATESGRQAEIIDFFKNNQEQ